MHLHILRKFFIVKNKLVISVRLCDAEKSSDRESDIETVKTHQEKPYPPSALEWKIVLLICSY